MRPRRETSRIRRDSGAERSRDDQTLGAKKTTPLLSVRGRGGGQVAPKPTASALSFFRLKCSHSRVAQLAERAAVNRQVKDSNSFSGANAEKV